MEVTLKYIKKLIKVFSLANSWLVLPSIVLLVVADIAMRSFFSAPIAWAHELLGLLLICLFFFGLPDLVRRRELLDVDFLSRHFSSNIKAKMDRLTHLLLLTLALLLCWVGLTAAWDMYRYQESGFLLPIPHWPFALLLAASALLVVFQSLHGLFSPSDTQQPSDISQ